MPNAEKIKTFTIRPELESLYELARGCPPGSNVLEIGSYLGASTCYIGAAVKQIGGRLFCIDTWQNETMPEGVRDTFAEFKQNTKGVDSVLHLVRKRSGELTSGDISCKFALIFIDADHTYDAVKADFDLARQWLADDGIVAFHDQLIFQGVARVVGEVLAGGSWIVAGQSYDLIWIRPRKFDR